MTMAPVAKTTVSLRPGLVALPRERAFPVADRGAAVAAIPPQGRMRAGVRAAVAGATRALTVVQAALALPAAIARHGRQYGDLLSREIPRDAADDAP